MRQIRHKYVARLHYVLEHHETQFPEILGFRRITVDFERAGGLDALIAQLKARHDWIQEEMNRYLNGPMQIGVFAHRIGMDTIEVGAGLASHGARLKVAAGNFEEREAADRAIRSNGRRGCVLDLLAFWTAWRIGALKAVRATCGPIHLPQSSARMRAPLDHTGCAFRPFNQPWNTGPPEAHQPTMLPRGTAKTPPRWPRFWEPPPAARAFPLCLAHDHLDWATRKQGLEGKRAAYQEAEKGGGIELIW